MSLPDPRFWRDRRVLVTGHTGFKGAWLALWLNQFGARVTGYALPPEHADGVYAATGLARGTTSVFGDLKDRSRLRHCIELMRPEIVFHLAAQALVRRAHRDPAATYQTNVSGTSEVLEACRAFPFVRAVVVVTSDKVYENNDEGRPFVENDRLGGREPYGASKAAAEIVTAAFRAGLPADGPAVATVRAGNVIGGGDWGEDRLVPDAVRAFRTGTPLLVRNPDATRPWQHVLDPLCGYLRLAERLVGGDDLWRSAWNFGGLAAEPVHRLADRMVELWSRSGIGHAAWAHADEMAPPYEAKVLSLDSGRAREHLGWQPRLALAEALDWTIDWYIAQALGEPMFGPSAAMIDSYMGLGA